ncbi:MAG: site-specific DNA-methyltransferase [Prevotellaceae bacterium]|jgi:DNA modification methylase|nr:site-specific DNA-methyltransferase [Prevotellaceae bacterium]
MDGADTVVSRSALCHLPPALIMDCIKAGCPPDGVVLDPFFGAGTTGIVARNLGRYYVGVEWNADYVKIAEKRPGRGVLF